MAFGHAERISHWREAASSMSLHTPPPSIAHNQSQPFLLLSLVGELEKYHASSRQLPPSPAPRPPAHTTSDGPNHSIPSSRATRAASISSMASMSVARARSLTRRHTASVSIADQPPTPVRARTSAPPATLSTSKPDQCQKGGGWGGCEDNITHIGRIRSSYHDLNLSGQIYT